jgi:NAD-dependent SIR2 family protein deacetylase
MERANPGWADRHRDVADRPDGDVALDETADFVVPDCERCGGLLKPDVVFFGENVPKARVERCYAAVERLAELGGALLVLGSSLTVMSGFRFVRHAAKLDVPVVIVNRGATRADELATVKVDVGTSQLLSLLSGEPLDGSGDVAAHRQQHAQAAEQHGVADEDQPAGPPVEVVQQPVVR